MLENTSWNKGSQVKIQIPSHMTGEFNIGFDEEIPENTQEELRRFVKWVEEHFKLPVPLWVDFEYKHYLFDRSRKRVDFLFYWADFHTYPVFASEEDIPVIRLPVRTERADIEEILMSFIEAISCYYAWILNAISDEFTCNENEVEEILQAYLSFRSNSAK